MDHPYRDTPRPMSPMYFSSDNNRSFYLDLRDIRFVQMDEDGEWTVKFKSQPHSYDRSAFILSPEEGARLYNALRAYNETNYHE